MEEKRVSHKILKQLSKVSMGNIQYFGQLFQEDAYPLLDRCKVVIIPKDTKFISSHDKINTIWILLYGNVKAVEEYSTGDIYIFQKFKAPEVFGEMEALSEISCYRASLITESECIFMKIPLALYIKFLKSNSEYLYLRTQDTLKRVLDDEREKRRYLKLNGIDRMKLYFIQYCQLNQKKGVCVIKNTRQQIADETGFSIKTVNRAIKKLKEQDLLKIQGQKILITDIQYDRMVKSMDEFIEDSSI